MNARPDFRRMILGLHRSALDRTLLDFATEFAELLGLDLFGLYIEEPSVAGLGAFPFAREFRTLGGRWEPIELERIAREFELSAQAARRVLLRAATSRRITCSFEIVKAAGDQAIASVSRATDILVIAEPRNPVERIVDSFPRLSAAAFRSAASVLLVPPRIARTRGPVLALVTEAKDPSLAAALAIAAAAKENLVIIEAYREGGAAGAAGEAAAPAPVAERLRLPPQARSDPRILLSALARFSERLIVLTRGALGADEALPWQLAAARRVPVLVVEPLAQASRTETPSSTGQ